MPRQRAQHSKHARTEAGQEDQITKKSQERIEEAEAKHMMVVRDSSQYMNMAPLKPLHSASVANLHLYAGA